MAGKLASDDEVISDINVTPLVDIMLVLLIIFMLTSESVSQKVRKPSIEVDLPTAASSDKKPTRPLNVVINKDGKLFLNAEETDAERLRAYVRQRVAQASSKKPEAVLSADRRVAHGKVVRIIDLLRLAGIENVAINTKEQEIE